MLYSLHARMNFVPLLFPSHLKMCACGKRVKAQSIEVSVIVQRERSQQACNVKGEAFQINRWGIN